MAGSVNRQILLKSRPEGAPSLGNFELTENADAGTRRERGAHAHHLSLTRPIHAWSHERRKIICDSGCHRASDGRWHGRGDRQVVQSKILGWRHRPRLWRLAGIRAFEWR